MDTLDLVKTLGVPTALLLLLAIAIWRSLQWLAANVVKPMVERHVIFLTKVEESLTLMASSLEQTRQAIELLGRSQREIELHIRRRGSPDKESVIP